jgi:hypothetical protein
MTEREVYKATTYSSMVDPTSNSTGKKLVIIILVVLANVITAIATISGFQFEASKPNRFTLTLSTSYKNQTPKISNLSFSSIYLMEGRAENDSDFVDTRLKSPFTATIAGPTGSGKTELIKRLINQSQTVCTVPPSEIIYCYGVRQDFFELFPKVSFHEGLIDVQSFIPSDGIPRWLIIDDLMNETKGNNEVDNIFTKYSHHKNLSVFLLVQNLFLKHLRTITLNSHYMMLFKNPRDSSQILNLGRQIYPNNTKFLVESYKDATKLAYSYLLLDMKQNTSDSVRVIGNYLLEDKSFPQIVNKTQPTRKTLSVLLYPPKHQHEESKNLAFRNNQQSHETFS